MEQLTASYRAALVQDAYHYLLCSLGADESAFGDRDRCGAVGAAHRIMRRLGIPTRGNRKVCLARLRSYAAERRINPYTSEIIPDHEGV